MKKLYYSIGEASGLTGLKPYVLRYWETEFPSLSPGKNRAGNRIYREKDIRMILYIKHLLYDEKYTIDGARKKIKTMSLDEIPDLFHSGEKEPDKNLAASSDESVKASVNSAEVEHYKKVIQELKRGLKEILELLDDKDGE